MTDFYLLQAYQAVVAGDRDRACQALRNALRSANATRPVARSQIMRALNFARRIPQH